MRRLTEAAAVAGAQPVVIVLGHAHQPDPQRLAGEFLDGPGYVLDRHLRVAHEVHQRRIESADLGNTGGWTINSSGQNDLYWVGGSGNQEGFLAPFKQRVQQSFEPPGEYSAGRFAAENN